MNIDRALIESDLDSLKLIQREKVRDLYEIDENKILIVQTDRVSAFDKVFPNGIANKEFSLQKSHLFGLNFLIDVAHTMWRKAPKSYLSKSDYLKVKERCL